LEAPAEQLTQRVYNIQGFSFTPSKLYKAIQKRIPQLQIKYKPDFRQVISRDHPFYFSWLSIDPHRCSE